MFWSRQRTLSSCVVKFEMVPAVLQKSFRIIGRKFPEL